MGVLYLVFQGMFVRPYDPDAALFNWLNGVRDWLETNRSGPFFVWSSTRSA